MKLNLGCGNARLDGWINVDREAVLKPDQVWDLERLPWPWAESSVDEVLLKHALEHLGQQTDVFLGIVKELWRVCRNGALITIEVPHPRHDGFLSDPTHVRPILPSTLALFDQSLNRLWAEQRVPNTALGLIHGVDFRIDDVVYVLDEPWRGRLASGELSQAEAEEAIRRFNNVVESMTIRWRVAKPEAR